MNKFGYYISATIITEKGIGYDVPNGLDNEKYNQLIEEYIDFTKEKGLTIRQAQYVFEACKDYVLESIL